MRDVVRYGLILLIITAVASALLGATNQITAPLIEANKAAAQAKAIAALLGVEGEENLEITEKDIEDLDPDVNSLFTATKDGAVIGFVFGVTPKGYGGSIEMLVALDQNGVVKGFEIIKHSETPGLGANAGKPAFSDQFAGKSSKLSVVKTNPGQSEVQAITAATITSKAVVKGVNDALEFFAAHKEVLN